MTEIELRPVAESDLDILFEHQKNKEANWMAAFTFRDPEDRSAFDAQWNRIMNDETVYNRTILLEGEVVGSIASFIYDGNREIGYWIDPTRWGQGIATAALREFLKVVPDRPLYAHAAKDNAASIRVMEKCGFEIIKTMRSFSNARNEEIEEVMLELRA